MSEYCSGMSCALVDHALLYGGELFHDDSFQRVDCVVGVPVDLGLDHAPKK